MQRRDGWDGNDWNEQDCRIVNQTILGKLEILFQIPTWQW